MPVSREASLTLVCVLIANFALFLTFDANSTTLCIYQLGSILLWFLLSKLSLLSPIYARVTKLWFKLRYYIRIVLLCGVIYSMFKNQFLRMLFSGFYTFRGITYFCQHRIRVKVTDTGCHDTRPAGLVGADVRTDSQAINSPLLARHFTDTVSNGRKVTFDAPSSQYIVSRPVDSVVSKRLFVEDGSHGRATTAQQTARPLVSIAASQKYTDPRCAASPFRPLLRLPSSTEQAALPKHNVTSGQNTNIAATDVAAVASFFSPTRGAPSSCLKRKYCSEVVDEDAAAAASSEATHRHATANSAKRVDRKVHRAADEALLSSSELHGAAGERVVHRSTEAAPGDDGERERPKLSVEATSIAATGAGETPQTSSPPSPLRIEAPSEREFEDGALDAPGTAPSTVAMSVVNSQNCATDGRFSPLESNGHRRSDDEPSLSRHAAVVQRSGGGLPQITVGDASVQQSRESGSKAKRPSLRDNAAPREEFAACGRLAAIERQFGPDVWETLRKRRIVVPGRASVSPPKQLERSSVSFAQPPVAATTTAQPAAPTQHPQSSQLDSPVLESDGSPTAAIAATEAAVSFPPPQLSFAFGTAPEAVSTVTTAPAVSTSAFQGTSPPDNIPAFKFAPAQPAVSTAPSFTFPGFSAPSVTPAVAQPSSSTASLVAAPVSTTSAVPPTASSFGFGVPATTAAAAAASSVQPEQTATPASTGSTVSFPPMLSGDSSTSAPAQNATRPPSAAKQRPSPSSGADKSSVPFGIAFGDKSFDAPAPAALTRDSSGSGPFSLTPAAAPVTASATSSFSFGAPVTAAPAATTATPAFTFGGPATTSAGAVAAPLFGTTSSAFSGPSPSVVAPVSTSAAPFTFGGGGSAPTGGSFTGFGAPPAGAPATGPASTSFGFGSSILAQPPTVTGPPAKAFAPPAGSSNPFSFGGASTATGQQPSLTTPSFGGFGVGASGGAAPSSSNPFGGSNAFGGAGFGSGIAAAPGPTTGGMFSSSGSLSGSASGTGASGSFGFEQTPAAVSSAGTPAVPGAFGSGGAMSGFGAPQQQQAFGGQTFGAAPQFGAGGGGAEGMFGAAPVTANTSNAFLFGGGDSPFSAPSSSGAAGGGMLFGAGSQSQSQAGRRKVRPGSRK